MKTAISTFTPPFLSKHLFPNIEKSGNKSEKP
jgi:hypothetical protein